MSSYLQQIYPYVQPVYPYLRYVYITIGVLSTTIISPIVLLISIQWARTYQAPPDLPWVGLKGKKFWPKLRANIREVSAGREPLNEAYEKYGKHGKACVLPALHWPEVVLPPTCLSWIANQPDNVLSGPKVQNDILVLDVLAHGPDLAAIYDFTVISRDLTRQTIHILADVLDEMKVSFEEHLDSAMEDYGDIKIFQIVQDVSRRVSNRVFVGLPLCRDKRYIKGLQRWETSFGLTSAVIRYLMPYSLKPVLAPVAALPLYFFRWRLTKMIVPRIQERVAAQSRANESKTEVDRPNDALQWIIDGTTRKGGTQKMTQDDIAGKTILFNFFAVHTTSMTVDNILVDILNYPTATSLIAELREEADAIMPKLESDPRAVRDMYKLDSVIRESLRLGSFQGRGLQREVVKPGGVTTPDGLYLPQGTRICTPMSSRQQDEEIWENANEYIPMRFYVPPEDRKGSEEKQWSAVHVTEQFLAFGFGKHACPGRFFAVQSLKLFLGYLLTHYDFEPLTERPKPIEIGETVIQNPKNTIKARRRKLVDDVEVHDTT